MNSILITGGSGYFGQAFVRFLLRNTSIPRICIFSRSEHVQALMRASLEAEDASLAAIPGARLASQDGQATPMPSHLSKPALSRLRFFIGDVRDYARLARAMQGCDTVVHAAALKRVEVGEYNPDEMVRTNVLGAMNVIEAAHNTPSVSRVVALSTDKACAPVNAYGATKLLVEKLFISANSMTANYRPLFSVTRYGNVAGSTGSVIPIFQQQIARGERIRVTNPDATRFWMSVDEACEMVYWLLENMQGGELVVPNLPAYRLGDLAQLFAIEEPEVIGLGKEEKLHESMISANELEGFMYNGKYFMKRKNYPRGSMLCAPLTSDTARRITLDELNTLLLRMEK